MIGLVNTRCSRCGCLVTDHAVDDEERCACQKCECAQFLAPPDPVLHGEPGSPEWWLSPPLMIQGPVDTILRLMEQEEISRRKALELLAYRWAGCPQDLQHALPPAPWGKLNWCDDPPSNLTVREACRQRVPLDGADAQALEHALTITERERDEAIAAFKDASRLRSEIQQARMKAEDERDDALTGVEAGERAAQSARELVNALREIEVLCGEEDDSPRSAVERVISERHSLRDWKAGATGAATISYPPRVGPHTEDAYCAHKSAYEGGSEDYRIGADVVAAAVLAAKESWAGALSAHDSLTCPFACPHGDQCALESGHDGGHNHRGCDCNEPDQPLCDQCGERKPAEPHVHVIAGRRP